MNSILKLQNVVKQYQNYRAVDNLSFEIPEASVFGFLGPNGAGKTSTIRIITTITKADSGQILFQNQPLSPNHVANIGYMPEERGLYKSMKVGETVLYLAQLKGMKLATAKIELNGWLKKFDIANWYDKPIEELSKGMQQKVQFISTVLHRPNLLILDEPFSGLDPINAILIQDEISEMHKNGTTIVFSTHRMEQVELICDHIVLINKGKNMLNGQVKQIKEDFKKHVYRVEWTGENWLTSEQAPFIITEKINSQTFKTEQSVYIQLKTDQSPQNALRYLLENGVNIIAFNEILPTFSEIFIQTVAQK
jgi:ABC-2 type transport system ATP-binding protein